MIRTIVLYGTRSKLALHECPLLSQDGHLLVLYALVPGLSTKGSLWTKLLPQCTTHFVNAFAAPPPVINSIWIWKPLASTYFYPLHRPVEARVQQQTAAIRSSMILPAGRVTTCPSTRWVFWHSSISVISYFSLKTFMHCNEQIKLGAPGRLIFLLNYLVSKLHYWEVKSVP